jgi:hypothetical protein
MRVLICWTFFKSIDSIIEEASVGLVLNFGQVKDPTPASVL